MNKLNSFLAWLAPNYWVTLHFQFNT